MHPYGGRGLFLEEGDEMKVCPHCQTVMEEKPGWDSDLKMPQLTAYDQAPALNATRIVGNAPNAHILKNHFRPPINSEKLKKGPYLGIVKRP
jgi:hypothetical protein